MSDYHLVIFGDSYVAVQKPTYRVSGGQMPKPKFGYYEGRYSTDELYPELLHKKLQFKSFGMYAHGYSTTSNSLTPSDIRVIDGTQQSIPDFKAQLANYEADIVRQYPDSKIRGRIIASTVFLISFNGNDIGAQFYRPWKVTKLRGSTKAAGTMMNITSGVDKLRKLGAHRFLLTLNPNLIKYIKPELPLLISITGKKAMQYQLENYATIVNRQTKLLVSRLRMQGNKVALMDQGSVMEKIARDPQAYGFHPEKAFEPAITTVIRKAGGFSKDLPIPKDRVFHDNVHPAGKTHKLLVKLAEQAIKDGKVLELDLKVDVVTKKA